VTGKDDRGGLEPEEPEEPEEVEASPGESPLESVKRVGGAAARAMLDAIFPPRCALCSDLLPGWVETGKPAPDAAALEVCEACHQLVRKGRVGGHCLRCDARLGPGVADQARCGHCLDMPAGVPPLWVCGAYDVGLGHAVRALKFDRKVGRAKPLGRLLANRIREAEAAGRAGGGPWTLVPIPSDARRDRDRGFNPAAVIARAAAKELGWPFDEDALLRIRPTPPLTGLPSRAARVAAVKGAFAADPERAGGGSMLLIDDVVTSGATLAECATALLAAGARSVRAAVVARRHLVD
jgi:predicted amidophosphoribosyltransferase